MEMVDKHNKEAEEGLHTYTLGENEFSDLTFQEFLDTMTGYNESLDFDILSDPTLEGKFPEDTFGFPQSWDCREHGLVSTVRSQGSCGSCWAFAAVGAVEGAWAKEKGQLYRLSEQELIDCDKSDGGCNGGGISSALTWVHNHHGLAKNADYGVGHYHPSEGNCHHKEEETVAGLTRVRHVASKNEADLKRAVHNAGPVAMSVHVNKVQGLQERDLQRPRLSQEQCQSCSSDCWVEVQHKVQEDKMDREKLMGKKLGSGRLHLPGVWEKCLWDG